MYANRITTWVEPCQGFFFTQSMSGSMDVIYIQSLHQMRKQPREASHITQGWPEERRFTTQSYLNACVAYSKAGVSYAATSREILASGSVIGIKGHVPPCFGVSSTAMVDHFEPTGGSDPGKDLDMMFSAADPTSLLRLIHRSPVPSPLFHPHPCSGLNLLLQAS